MYSLSRTLVKGVVWVGVAMVVIVVLQIGGLFALRVGQFSPLTGAFIGGALVLSSALLPMRKRENTEPWIGHEQAGWVLIGLGVIMWGIGESFWRYYMSIGQAPFPSAADIGYSIFPVLVFMGLLLQPSSESGGKRFLLLMDSLISMGSILAIAWYLLLGPLAQMPGEANLAKFLGLCLCFFVTSDFIFNIQNNAGTYVEATWFDLGWPLGMMTIGIAAYLRRFLPATPPEVIQQRMEDSSENQTFGLTRFVPYVLLALLFLVLSFNVLSTNPEQYAIRPILLAATMGVVALVVIRQIFTLWENARLAQQQAESLSDLERANKRIEEQTHLIADHSAELERGIVHLKDVHAQLANGNLRARANLTSGALLPLEGSLNLMAERLTRLGQTNIYMHHLLRALDDLSTAFERQAAGAPFIVPESSNKFIEINRLLRSMRVKRSPTPLVTHPLTHPNANVSPHSTVIQRPVTQPLEHNTSELLDPHIPLQRQTVTPLPQRTSVPRLGIRTVAGSRQPPSSEPLH